MKEGDGRRHALLVTNGFHSKKLYMCVWRGWGQSVVLLFLLLLQSVLFISSQIVEKVIASRMYRDFFFAWSNFLFCVTWGGFCGAETSQPCRRSRGPTPGSQYPIHVLIRLWAINKQVTSAPSDPASRHRMAGRREWRHRLTHISVATTTATGTSEKGQRENATHLYYLNRYLNCSSGVLSAGIATLKKLSTDCGRRGAEAISRCTWVVAEK